MSLGQFGSLKKIDGADIPFKYGFSTVIDFFAKSFNQDEVLLNSVVDKIEWGGESAEIQIRGRKDKVLADSVIVTVSLGVLKVE